LAVRTYYILSNLAEMTIILGLFASAISPLASYFWRMATKKVIFRDVGGE
jgi:hypothetical protein